MSSFQDTVTPVRYDPFHFRDSIDPGLIYILQLRSASDLEQPASSPIMDGDASPIASNAIGGLDAFSATGSSGAGHYPEGTPGSVSPLQRDFATEDWTTGRGDVVEPNLPFDGRLTSGAVTTRSVPMSPAAGSEISSEIDTLTLINSDGALDSLADDENLQGAVGVVSAGPRGGGLNTYGVLATGTVQRVDVGASEAQITLTSRASQFETTFNTRKYLNTGHGLEGPPDLEGVVVPVLLGQCYNIEPILLDPANLIFQISDQQLTTLGGVSACRHGGVSLSFRQDHVNYAALAAATVPVGEFDTCLSAGLVRPGLTAGGVDSFSVTVDAWTTPTEGAEIAEWLMEKAEADLDVTIDAAAWAQLVSDLTGYVYGLYLTETITWREVIDHVMRSIGAVWGADRTGAIACGVMEPPDPGGTPDLVLTEPDILDIDRLGLPDGYEYVFSQQAIRWRKNYTPNGALAGIVTTPSLSVEWRERVVDGATTSLTAKPGPVIETGLQTVGGAQQLADRILDLHGTLRTLVSVTIPATFGWIGELALVHLTYPRFGLDGGRYFIVTAIQSDHASGRTTLTLWG